MNAIRVNELMKSMRSFEKLNYHKSEILDELLALQSEIVNLTFNGDHASTADLRIYDVEKHLERLNEEIGHKADKELGHFISGSKALCNMIKAEICGTAGESKAFKALESVQTRNIVLKNIELKDNEERTEIDAIVITPFSITIVEVKNYGKDMFIDGDGCIYRTGEFLRKDCDLAAKMELKERLLRAVIKSAGYEAGTIHKLVVFTNTRIEVQNKCSSLRTCFVSQLPYIIDGFNGDFLYTPEAMEQIMNAITSAECKELYPIGFDVDRYKRDFAETMTIIEEEKLALNAKCDLAESIGQEAEITDYSREAKEKKAAASPRRFTLARALKCAGAVIALTAVSVLSGVVVSKYNSR